VARTIDPVAGSSDAELETGVIGGPTLHDDAIRLVEYDAVWPDLFEREAARIRATLGPAALRVDHVGSTSVPGLAAKPIIDIVLTVVHASDEATYVPALEAAGYVVRAREPEWFEHRLLNGPDTDVNVHVFSAGCSEIDRMLRFRDHLRVDEADRVLYERTKRELAARRWRYVQDYADAKSDVIADIMTGAQPQR
jgi:GrpB-like predicted nucleotidyltransferase (UPF0157 family)